MYTTEKAGSFSRAFRACLLPIVSIDIIGNILIKGSNSVKKLKENATTYKALEIVYNYSWENTKETEKRLLKRIFTYILFNTCVLCNYKAVRNRLKIVKKELEKQMSLLNGKDICIMSLGSGSARAIIETLETEKKEAKAILIDMEEEALEYAEALAKKKGVREIIPKKGLIREFVKNGRIYSPDIIEMVGILEYFDDSFALKVLKKVYEILPQGGVLITANLRDNPEREFLENVLDWFMIYREPKEFKELLLKAGFKEVRLEIDPVGIHVVAVCLK